MATLADLLIEIGVDAREVTRGAAGVEGTLKKTWAGVGKAAAIGGAAIGAALMAGIDQVIEQSKPAALLTAQLGAGTPVAAQAGAAAGEVYAKGVVGSMEDATGAVKAAVQNALVPPDASSGAIANVANQIANLSTVMEEDAGRVSSAVSQMIRTGMVKSAQEGFDVLQKGVEMGVNKSEDLLDTFNEYGTQFRKFGLDAETAMGLLSQGLKGGARDSDVVADSLKELALRIADGSVKAAGGFKAIGMDSKQAMKDFAAGGDDASMVLSDMLEGLNKIKDPAKRNAAALALFGTKFEDLGDAAFSLNMGNAASSLGKVEGAAKKAGDTLEQSAGAKLESFKRAAQGALVEKLAQAIPYLESAAKWIQKNADVLGPLAVVLGLVAAALGVAAIAQWAMNSALLASPVTWMVVGIALIVAGIIILINQLGGFKAVWAAVWGFLKGIGAWFAGPFANFFVQIGTKIKNFAVGAWNAVRNQFGKFAGMFTSVKNWGASATKWLTDKFNAFVGFIRGIPGKIKSSLVNMWSGLKEGFRSAINWVISRWNSLKFTIPSFSAFGHTFGGGTIGVPGIPSLANGGIIPASPGGTIAQIGEGGQDEAVIPLDRLPDIAQGQRQNTTVVQIVPGGEQEFRRWINRSIRVKGAFASGS